MEIRPLPAEEAAVRRFAAELWIPYNRDLEATVDAFALSDEVDLVPAETWFRLERLEEDDYEAWIAVDPASSGDDADSGTTDDDPLVDGDLVGFVTTEVDASPSVFARPDRLVVGDVYVREDHRGTDLAERLMGRAAERAREAGCSELALDVDVANERAVAFYEKLGLETYRHRMRVAVDDLESNLS